MKTLYLIAGARPNFMKIAPIVRAIREDGRLSFRLVHTGQHYDHDMNDVFFEELGIPAPDIFLGTGGGSHAQQTARIMVAFEDLCLAAKPDAVLVVGDVNSTMACAIVAKKLHVPVAHVEAGLRSGDLRMPEEINRLVTDSISDWFFATEASAVDNLLREGKPRAAVHFVGNVMVDNLLYQVGQLRKTHGPDYGPPCPARPAARYGVVTLHRPSNVDDPATLRRICDALQETSARMPLVFPVHPRTRANLDRFGIRLGSGITLTGPQGYMDFLQLWMDAAVVLTDSGGLQEETTALGVPCITIRDNTERPVTVAEGTNVLAGTDPRRIVNEVRKVLEGKEKGSRRPQLWDGMAAKRLIGLLAEEMR